MRQRRAPWESRRAHGCGVCGASAVESGLGGPGGGARRRRALPGAADLRRRLRAAEQPLLVPGGRAAPQAHRPVAALPSPETQRHPRAAGRGAPALLRKVSQPLPRPADRAAPQLPPRGAREGSGAPGGVAPATASLPGRLASGAGVPARGPRRGPEKTREGGATCVGGGLGVARSGAGCRDKMRPGVWSPVRPSSVCLLSGPGRLDCGTAVDSQAVENGSLGTLFVCKP